MPKKSASTIGKSRPVLGAGRNPVTGGSLILARFFFLTSASEEL